MIFTLYYMYATFIQWWRLGSLRNKLSGTINSHNALLVCSETVIYDTKKSRSFENLLFRNGERIGCTIVPRQKVNLSQWLVFPRDYRYFPIFFKAVTPKISPPHVYILIQAMLETYVKHSADLLEIENFGELIGWRIADYFEAILKTDMDKLTKLVHCYSQGNIDINHELKLLKIETVDVDGLPTRIIFEKRFSTDFILKYSHAPVHWKKFTESLKEIYSKIRDSTNPKITIENGKSDERKVPVSEVKPIKKDRRHDDRHTLDVSGHKTDHKTKAKEETSRRRPSRTEESSRDRHHKREDKSKPRKDEDEKDGDVKHEERTSQRKDADREKHHRKEENRSRSRHDRDRERDRSKKRERDDAKNDEADTSTQAVKDAKRHPSTDRVKSSKSREEPECSKSKRESSKSRLEEKEKSKSKERESSSVVDSSRSSKNDTKSKESSHSKDTKHEKKLQKEKSKSDTHQKPERSTAKRSGSGDKKLVKRSLAVDDTEHDVKASESVKENVESTSVIFLIAAILFDYFTCSRFEKPTI
ncbi:unnamed protein product [Acanthoscelides obtectus]|uniref:Uncharacterized protein n=1 Tax=Acanthoscelides obtectus TaxID=200917 RepID=A0A9P0LVS0_ACAOB|nr:unnamed protein product [Acanthoscelides obtectus]CAK1660828.1 hypothetical protein AOBTE_LOCUS22283 [Acanthoscelides obtectus]